MVEKLGGIVTPISVLPIIISLLLAVVTVFFLQKRFGLVRGEGGRFVSIDGLRGYLAFFVFLHHSSVWYFYLHTERWGLPSSNLYTHLGRTSVVFFFMITGFLFFTKIIDNKNKEIDWLRLFVSRILRLTPLYLFVVVVVLLVVAILSNWGIKEPLLTVSGAVMRWGIFSMLDHPLPPDINKVYQTFIIVAGVTWSLPYEWLFYFALPIFYLINKGRPPVVYVTFSVVMVAGVLLTWNPGVYRLLPFLGGLMASILVKSDGFRRFSVSNLASLVVVSCVSTVVIVYPDVWGVGQMILLSISFVIIAAGNTLFGILSNKISCAMGEISYSIYLLHGIFLFVAFTFIFDRSVSVAFTPVEHWLLVMAVTPVLLTSCCVTFLFIERPTMEKAKVVTEWLRSKK